MAWNVPPQTFPGAFEVDQSAGARQHLTRRAA